MSGDISPVRLIKTGVGLLGLVLVLVSLRFLLDGVIQPPMVRSAATAVIQRISVNSSGSEADGASSMNAINSDGTYVAFASLATNLVDGDSNGVKDIFVRDLSNGTTTRVSVSDSGVQGNGESDSPAISADGRYVAFESEASNLVSGDTNGVTDIFVYDRTLSTIERVSVKSDGTQGDDHSLHPVISDDGRYVAFQSAATNLVTGDTNGVTDIFVHDRTLNTTTRVSVKSDGTQANNYSLHPAISGDGRYIAFSSIATNLVASDTNSVSDVFLHDRELSTTIRVSVASDGTEADALSVHPAISNDGRYIGFESDATNLLANNADSNGKRDIFVHDRELSTTTRVSVDSSGTEANNNSGDSVDTQNIALSQNGQYVVFKSLASNLVSDDTNGVIDVFVHDRQSAITTRVSITNLGGEANGVSYYPHISDDGRFISFYSYASNLVDSDNNATGDIFVYSRDAVSPTATPTASPTPTPNPVTISLSQNTSEPTETTVSTPGGNVTVRCESVNTGGTLSVLTLTVPPGQLASHITALRTNFEITRTDLACNTLTLCLPYSDTDVSNASLSESSLRMFHYSNSNWEDVTSSQDTANNQVCGRPTSFSPFVLGISAATPTPTPTTTDSGSSPTSTPTSELPRSGVIETTIWVAVLMFGVLGFGLMLLL